VRKLLETSQTHRYLYLHLVQHLARLGLTLLLLGVVTLEGAVDLSAQIPIAQTYHKSWTPRDGAPNNIEDIARGGDGFLWLTTDDGLYRFDGVSFERYTSRDGSRLPSEHLIAIAATRDGSIWVSYATGGIGRIKNGQVANFGEGDGLRRGQISQLLEDKDGSVWAKGTAGLQVITQSKVTQIGAESGLPAETAGWLATDNDGNLWVPLQRALMVLPHGAKRFLVVPREKYEAPSVCRPGREAGVWCWTFNGNGPIRWFRLSGSSIHQVPVAEGVRPRGLLLANDGTVWMTSEGRGIERFSASLSSLSRIRSSELERFTSREGLTGDFTFQVLEDREGSIWVATTRGLDQFRPVPFRAVDLGQGPPVILPLGKSDPQTLVATDHLIELTSSGPVSLPIACNEWTRSLFRGQDGTLWIGTAARLLRYAGGKLIENSLPLKLNGVRAPILAMVEDDSHEIWISIGSGNGVFKFDGNRWIKWSANPGGENAAALTAMKDHEGGLWFGFQHDLIARVFAGRVQEFGKSSGLDIGDVKAFAESGDDFWAGGENGVAVSRGGRFRPLLLAGGEALLGVTGLAFAPDGALWINEGSGVIRIEKAELPTSEVNPRPAKYRSFDYRDGLQGIPHPLVGLGSAWMAPDGRLYIATRTNLQWVDPLHLPQAGIPPPVWITEVKWDGRTTNWPSMATALTPRVASLQINYTATSLLIPDRVRFRYRLDGYDQGWIDAGSRRQAFYSKLPPRVYTFRVAASNDAGVWNDSGVSITLTVPPAFTQTIWFDALCVAAFGSLCLLAYRLRLQHVTGELRQRMYERLAERERIARDLHDTFFQSIQGLLLRFHTATSGLPKDDPTRRILEETLKQSDQVMLEGRELVLDLRAKVSESPDLPAAFAEYGKQMQDGQTCKFEAAVNGEARCLHPVVFEEVWRIGKEALGNAFQHSGAKAIEAELNYEPQELRIRIRDDGVGIDPDILKQGCREGHWGFPGMRERAAKIGARLDIWSRAGAGTEIELRLAANVAYAPEPRRGAADKRNSLWPRRRGVTGDSSRQKGNAGGTDVHEPLTSPEDRAGGQ